MQKFLTGIKYILLFSVYFFQLLLICSLFSIFSLPGVPIQVGLLIFILMLAPLVLFCLKFNKSLTRVFDGSNGNVHERKNGNDSGKDKLIYHEPLETGLPTTETTTASSILNTGVNQKGDLQRAKYLPMEPYSFSRIRAFVDCKYRFYQKYVLKQNSGYESKIARIGKEVHQSIANLLKDRKVGNLNFSEERLFRELKRLETTLSNEQYKDAQRMLRKFQKQTIFQSHEKIIAIESKFEENLPSGRKFIWIADLIVTSFDKSYLKIIDFKTGRTPKEIDYKYFENKQVQIYAAFAMRRFSYLRSRASFHYLQKDQKFESKISSSEGNYLIEYLDAKCSQIESELQFVPNPSATCYFCEYRDTCESSFSRRAG